MRRVRYVIKLDEVYFKESADGKIRVTSPQAYAARFGEDDQEMRETLAFVQKALRADGNRSDRIRLVRLRGPRRGVGAFVAQEVSAAPREVWLRIVEGRVIETFTHHTKANACRRAAAVAAVVATELSVVGQIREKRANRF